MIRINLLPVRQTQKRQTIQQQLLAAAAMVVVTIIVCIVWAASVSSTYDSKLKIRKQKQDELAQLQKIIGEVNDVQRDQERSFKRSFASSMSSARASRARSARWTTSRPRSPIAYG